MADAAEPSSWQLLEFLKARVQLILCASGFRTDIGAGLIVLDDSEIPEDPLLPAVTIEAGDATTSSSATQHANSELDVVIEYSLPRVVGDNPKLMAHRARADLMRVLLVNRKSLPPQITQLQITSASLGSTAEQDLGVSYVIAQVTVRASLVDISPPAQS